MAVIKHEDLFDFPGYNKAIKDLEAANKEFGKTVTAINDRISAQYKEIKGDLKAYSDVLKSFHVNQKGAVDSIIKTGDAALKTKAKLAEQSRIMQELVGVQNLSTRSVNELKTGLKGLEAQYNSIGGKSDDARAKQAAVAAEARRVKAAIQEQTAALKVTKTAMQAAEGSYAALQKELTDIGKQLKAMPNAFDNLTGKLNKNNKEAVALAKRYSEINNSLKASDAILGNFQRNVGNYTSAFKGMSGVLRSASSDLLSIVGLVSVGSFLKDATDEFLEADKKIRILKNTLNNVGLPEAFGRIETKVKDLQTQFSFLDDDDIIEVFNNLLRYGKLTENQINELIPVIIDFSVATGQDLSQSTSLIIKALEGNGRALKEFGIDMKDAKSVTEGFDLVMKELKPRVEGVGKAFGDSAAGGVAKSKQEFKDLKEEVGTGLIPILNTLLSLLSKSLKGLSAFAKGIKAEIEGTGTLFASLAVSAAENPANQAAAEQVAQSQLATFQARVKKFEAAQKQGQLIDKTVDDVRKNFVDQLNKQILRTSELIKQKSKFVGAFDEQAKQDVLGLQITLNGLQKALQLVETTGVNLNKVIGGGDPDKEKGGGAREDLIKKQQWLLKKLLDETLAQLELDKEKQLISEEEFQIKKLNLIKKYADAATELEGKRKGGADKETISDINKTRIDAEKEYQKFITEFSKNNLKEDLERAKKAIEDQANFAIEAKQSEKEFVLSEKRLTDKERKALEIQYQNDIDNILIDSLERRINLETDAEKKKDLELKKLQLERGISVRNRIEEEQAIEDKYQTEIRAAKTAFDIIRAGRDTSFREELAFLEKLKAIKIKYAKDTAEEELAIAELKAERERRLRDEVADTINLALQTGLEITHNLINDSFEDSIAKLNEQKEQELVLAGNNANARALIEERYNKRIADQKNKQARAEKNFALFQIALNTGIAVAKTIAEWGMPFAIPFIALTIVQGALQAALVASRPIPKYKKGRKGGPAEYAVVDEEGPELIIDKTGRLREVGGEERVTYLNEGDSVVTAKETERILKMTAITNEMNLHSRLSGSIKDGKHTEMIYVMSKAMNNNGDIEKAFEKAIKKIPVHQTIFDERGIRERDKTVSGTTTYLANLTKN